MILAKTGDLIIPKTVSRVGRAGLKDGARVSIVFVQAIIGAKPHKPLTILKNAVDGVRGQTIFNGQMVEIVTDGLSVRHSIAISRAGLTNARH